MYTEDMKRAATLWLEYTEKMRDCPYGAEVWNYTGDSYVSLERPQPWISEMYGYAFGCAMAKVGGKRALSGE